MPDPLEQKGGSDIYYKKYIMYKKKYLELKKSLKEQNIQMFITKKE